MSFFIPDPMWLLLFGSLGGGIAGKIGTTICARSRKTKITTPKPQAIESLPEACPFFVTRVFESRLVDSGVIRAEEMSVCDNDKCSECLRTRQLIRRLEDQQFYEHQAKIVARQKADRAKSNVQRAGGECVYCGSPTKGNKYRYDSWCNKECVDRYLEGKGYSGNRISVGEVTKMYKESKRIEQVPRSAAKGKSGVEYYNYDRVYVNGVYLPRPAGVPRDSTVQCDRTPGNPNTITVVWRWNNKGNPHSYREEIANPERYVK